MANSVSVKPLWVLALRNRTDAISCFPGKNEFVSSYQARVNEGLRLIFQEDPHHEAFGVCMIKLAVRRTDFDSHAKKVPKP